MDKNDFEIDQHALDVEWLRQATLYHKYATALADAKRSLDEAKADEASVHAETQMNIRDNPESYGLSKVTEAGIAAALQEVATYKEAVRATIVAKHRVDSAQADLGAIDQKRRALENLVELFGMDYFNSEPRARTAAARNGIDELESEAAYNKIRRKRKQRAAEADDDT